MNELPRTFFGRLKKEPERYSLRRSSAGRHGTNGAVGPAPHPDASLVAAFVDRTLPDKEQTRIMEHLSGCEPCREVVKAASPRIDFTIHNGQHSRPERSGSRQAAQPVWGRPRWGALAPIAAIAIAGLFYWTTRQPSVKVAQNLTEAPLAFSPPRPIFSRTITSDDSAAIAANILSKLAPERLETSPQKTAGAARTSAGAPEQAACPQARKNSSGSPRQRRNRKISHNKVHSQETPEHSR
jgi:hypothetical protein